MEALLAANPEPGSIKRGLGRLGPARAWARLQAIEAAGRQGEGIVITGIDANPQARDAIASGRQLRGLGRAGFRRRSARPQLMPWPACYGGETIKEKVIYVPTRVGHVSERGTLIRVATAGDFTSPAPTARNSPQVKAGSDRWTGYR
jgi:ribose transport system substrate-binding protein